MSKPSFRKIAYFHLSSKWKNPEIRKLGPFIVELRQRLRDGQTLSMTSRAYRKGFAPRILPEHSIEIRRSGTPILFVLSLSQINAWIGILFMIGSALFISGSAMSLFQIPQQTLNALTYFIGSIFFTLAAYIQYFQAINTDHFAKDAPETAERKRWFDWQPKQIGFWITFTQFIGTLLFNINTFNPFWVQTRFQENLFVWTPNIQGSILFMISGTLAMMEICKGRVWCWKPREIEWNLTFINFLGCVAFLLSALLAFSNPDPLLKEKWIYSDGFTLIGAICFFTGAYLTLSEAGKNA
jgi:hypothetical protein